MSIRPLISFWGNEVLLRGVKEIRIQLERESCALVEMDSGFAVLFDVNPLSKDSYALDYEDQACVKMYSWEGEFIWCRPSKDEAPMRDGPLVGIAPRGQYLGLTTYAGNIHVVDPKTGIDIETISSR